MKIKKPGYFEPSIEKEEDNRVSVVCSQEAAEKIAKIIQKSEIYRKADSFIYPKWYRRSLGPLHELSLEAEQFDFLVEQVETTCGIIRALNPTISDSELEDLFPGDKAYCVLGTTTNKGLKQIKEILQNE